MPTFFQRRYQRGIERIGNTEKVLGVLFLLLAAGIVAVFITQVITDEGYLFEVTEATELPRPFPALGLDGWRTLAQVSCAPQGRPSLRLRVQARTRTGRP